MPHAHTHSNIALRRYTRTSAPVARDGRACCCCPFSLLPLNCILRCSNADGFCFQGIQGKEPEGGTRPSYSPLPDPLDATHGLPMRHVPHCDPPCSAVLCCACCCLFTAHFWLLLTPLQSPAAGACARAHTSAARSVEDLLCTHLDVAVTSLLSLTLLLLSL